MLSINAFDENGLRKVIALVGSGTLDFGSIAINVQADLTITVTGAEVGDCVSVGLPSTINAALNVTAFVSAADTVTVRAHNGTTAAVDTASGTYRVMVFKPQN